MIEIRPLTEPEALQSVLRHQPLQPFLQSWSWGEFQAAVGRKIWRLGAWEGDQLVGAALAVEHALLMGKTYIYCPRGPLAESPDVFRELVQAMRKIGQETGAMYLKVDPGKTAFPIPVETIPGASEGTTLQPRQTLLIDVARSPAELLAAMHQKTRYNIRLAEKRGVGVRWSEEDQDFEKFIQLMHGTYSRQGIRLHSDAYYRLLFTTLREAKLCNLGLAEFEGTLVAANLNIWSEKTVTYLHGGSADVHKDVMAPHLLQWKTIELAHERGMTAYDLWGIAPENQPQHKWSGVTRFKKGLGGNVEVFPPAVNIVLQPSWYWAYRLAKRMRGGVDE